MQKTIQLSPKQIEAFKILFDDTTEVLIYGGGGGGGKSWLGCTWLMVMCLAYPGTKYFIARKSLVLVERSTLDTFHKVGRAMGCAKAYKYNKESKKILFNNGSKIDILELKENPSDPHFADEGSIEYTCGFIDECDAIPFSALQIMSNSRVGRWLNKEYGIHGKVLGTCNPNLNWVYHKFYKPYIDGTLKDTRKFVSSLAKDNFALPDDYLKRLHNMEDGALKERILEGNWHYNAPPDQVIPYLELEKCFTTPKVSGKKSFGVDVARYGNDRCVIAKMEGNSLYEIKDFQKIDTVEFAGIIHDEMELERVESGRVAIDVDGLGGGTVDTLKNTHLRKVVMLQSGSSPILIKALKKYKFTRLRSQMWMAFRESVLNGEFHIALDPTSKLANQLMAELTAPTYEIKDGGAIQVELKKNIKQRIGYSPDLADAVIYVHWMWYMNKEGRGERGEGRGGLYREVKTFSDVFRVT